ncbi:MAG: type I glyceraldehyde-3-phosphate dehydrogenase, partial [Deltaproteobacteria bacterium]|nr:type I glyceraldehyde-3-phosphate dehydrogenase [Deltaproteobacteria bacterium]
MTTRIAINGFGRIGRCFLRILHQRQIGDLELVAVNDLVSADLLAHLLKYDTIHRTFGAEVAALEGYLSVGGKKIKVLAEREPAKLPWKDLGIDVAI